MSSDQLRFIDRLYKDLYLDDSAIRYGTGKESDKFKNVKAYMDKLSDIHDKTASGRHQKMLRKMYHDKYVIQAEEIPESYYKHRQEIALERGYGHVEMTGDMKKQYQEQIITDQRASLDIWLNYFLSEDAKVYPFWAKYWAFQGMLKLGNYDKKTGTFSKRTKDTVAPFVDLNREALAMSIDVIIRMFNSEDISDKRLQELARNGSFQKIYAYILTNLLRDNKDVTKKNDGIWVKYDQGSDHMKLVKSLYGYNTGWCTAGESTAKSQLSMGDFYVYYTLDENNEYKVPRVAIRMEYGKIAEIRGIAKAQNIEPEMESVVEEKIKDFPDRDKYYKKVNDMKQLTLIYKKHKNGEDLTIDELKFLYEMDSEIVGFGYKRDPRILEIRTEREPILDLNKIFKNMDYFEKSLNLDYLTSADGLVLPQNIEGSLSLGCLTTAKGLVLPQSVGGSLNLRSLTSAEGLTLPQRIDGSLMLNCLFSAKDLVLPQRIGGTLNLSSLTSANGLVLPQNIGCDLLLGTLPSADGLVLPQNIDGTLNLNGLTSAEGLTLPQRIGGSLELYHLISAKNLTLPQKIGGSLYLSLLISAKGLVFPQRIGGSLELEDLISAEGLVLPQHIGGTLNLSSLTSTEGLGLPQNIGGDLILSSLTSAEGLVLPQRIGGTLNLTNLISTESLKLPTNIGGNLVLRKISSTNGLILPESVVGLLDLSGLTNAKGLTLPKFVGALHLGGLTSAKDLVLPDNIDGNLLISSLETANGLVLPKKVGGELDLSGLISAEGLILPEIVGGLLDLSSLISAEGLTLPQCIGGTLYLYGLTSVEGLILPDMWSYDIFLKDTVIPKNLYGYMTGDSQKKK